MSEALNYILTNSLPCKTYLDLTDLSSQSIMGTTYTARNLTLETKYDFLQNNLALHPSIEGEGVIFSGSQRLQPRFSDILLNAKSYTIIIISANIDATQQVVFEVGKTNSSLPKLLQLYYEGKEIVTEYSRQNVQDVVVNDGLLEETQITILSHDVVSGIANTSINKSDFYTTMRVDNGYLLNNFPSTVYLGNSANGLPFTGKLSQFLLFSPQISNFDAQNITSLLTNYVPQSQLKLDKILFRASSELNEATTFTNESKVKYVLPVVINKLSANSQIEIVYNLVAIASYKWNDLSGVSWDSLTTNLWDYIS